MNNIKAIAILILVILGGVMLYFTSRPPELVAEQPSEAESVSQANTLPTRIDEQASVKVAVTPQNIFSQSAEWRFGIIMDTHSVELDQDLTQSAVLIDADGKEYKPLRWEGASGGHHREGALIFPSITPRPNYLKLEISGLAEVTRIFLWEF